MRMRQIVTAAMVTAMLGGPVLAEEARLSGTVAEVFGRQAIVATPEGRLLVTLPEGVATPLPGQRVEMSGERQGATFRAQRLEAGPSGSAGAVAAGSLPAPLAALQPTEVLTRRDIGRHGREVIHVLRLPDGTWLRAKTREGRLTEVRSDGAALPEALVTTLLPPGLRSDPTLARLRRIVEIDVKPRGEIEVKGLDADGRHVEAEFWPSGELRKFEFERGHWRAPSPASARAQLEALGYQQIALVKQGPRHVEAIAVNPYGERVEVRMNAEGRVDRERLWHR